MGRRVLVTGLGTFWGGRVAQALEADPSVDVIVGLDTREPTVELDRTEYVRTDEGYSILSHRACNPGRHDPAHLPGGRLVPGFEAAGARDQRHRHDEPVRRCEPAREPGDRRGAEVVDAGLRVDLPDPVWFAEDTRARRRPVTASSARSSRSRPTCVTTPSTTQVAVTTLRFSNVLGSDIVAPITRALALPLVPAVFGFDPGCSSCTRTTWCAIMFVLDRRLEASSTSPGMVCCHGARWPRSAKHLAPPPFGRRLYAGPLARLGVDLPPSSSSC